MSDWIEKVTEQLGYFGVLLLMAAENIFPPIPSEVVMPFAGFTSREGQLSFVGVVAAGSLGSLLGALPWYFLGRYFGERRIADWIQRYGKWLTITPSEFERAKRWFEQLGGVTVLACRMVPGARTLISVPAGFAQMPFTPFLIYSAIGTLGWTALLAWLGWTLGDDRDAVDRYGGWIGTVVIALLVLWWLVRLWRRRDASGREQPA